MGNYKIRVIGLVVALAVLVLALFPGPVQASSGECHFYGPVVMSNGSQIPSNILIKATINGVSAGPWTAVPIYTLAKWKYDLYIPLDNPGTPEKEGGQSGDTVVFRALVNGYQVLLTFNQATFLQAGNVSMTISLASSANPDVPVEYMGDADGDGLIGIGDVITIENYMREPVEPWQSVLAPGADADGDGQIGIGDVITIENMMRTGPEPYPNP